jgi:hypothetical protein
MVKRIEALEQENTRHAQRELSWFVDDDGYWVVKGRFTLEQGAVIQKALEQVMEESFREQRDVSAETSDEALADEIKPRPEPIMLRRADALVRMAQGYGSDKASPCGGDRFLVHAHTDMETLSANGSGAEAELEEIGNIPAETARRLACDAGMVHWLERSEGSAAGGSESGGHASGGSHLAGHALNYWPLSAIPGFRGTGASLHIGRKTRSIPWLSRHRCIPAHWPLSAIPGFRGTGASLHIGRKTRSIPPAIQRALQRRDGGCRFPGCTCTRFVDAHHMQHWADGGETSMNNLVLLCRKHHRLVHEGGFAIGRSPVGDIHFSDPAGRIIPTGPDARFSGNVPALFMEHEQSGIHITPKTQIPNWLGEKMDDQLAVEGLLFRE